MDKIDKSDKIAKHISDIMLKNEPEYAEEFNEWMNENNDTDCLKTFSDRDNLYANLEIFSATDKETGAIELLQKIERLHRHRIIRKITILTAAVIAVSAILWYDKKPAITVQSPVVIAMSDLMAPKLILSDGDVILLNDDTVTKRGNVINSQGMVVIKSNVTHKDNKLNRLIVPAQNTYSIVLSDGTKVILNANSELMFPEKFDDNERVVTLKGEGYFEVAKDSSRKFIVKNNDLNVEVYGTKFNIDGYNKDAIFTFLLNGSISVACQGHTPQMLKPMQMANINSGSGTCVIHDVTDESEYIAWVDNFFSFNATPINRVIEEIERWYGVTLDKTMFDNKNIVITGSFNRKTELSEILQTIEKITKIKILN